MSNDKRKRLYNWFFALGTAFLIGLLTLSSTILVEIRDTMKYKQPQRDSIQNYYINSLDHKCTNLDDFTKNQEELNQELLNKMTIFSGDLKRLEEKQDYTIDLLKKDEYTFTTYLDK